MADMVFRHRLPARLTTVSKVPSVLTLACALLACSKLSTQSADNPKACRCWAISVDKSHRYTLISKAEDGVLAQSSHQSTIIVLMAWIRIGMPFHNGEPYLRETVERVLRQSVEEFELITVEDRSQDGSSQSLVFSETALYNSVERRKCYAI